MSLKSEQKLVKIVHVSRQKLLQHAKAYKNTSQTHVTAIHLVVVVIDDKMEEVKSLLMLLQ